MLTFPPHRINASALPCETENTEIVSFHVYVACLFANKSHRNYDLITVRLHFIHKTMGCVHQTRPRKGKKACSYLFCTHLSDHCICHGVRLLGCHVNNESFSSSSMNCMSMDSITGVFYHLNKTLIATKHIADNNFVFQQDNALAHLVCNIVQTSQLHFFWPMTSTAQMRLVDPTDYKI